jgi:hypothetical protein
VFVVVALICAVAASGIDWGLPSAERAKFIYGWHQPWTGKQVQAFEPRVAAAADIDATPLPADQPSLWLSDTDAARAEMVRRYLLFSSQPDEMQTFMALQQMNPSARDFDPKMYKYGGLWVYPVGALLKAAAVTGLIDLRPDSAFYYENPAAFGRFYVVARAYTLAWFAVLMAAAAVAVRRLGHSDTAAVATAALVGLLPACFAMAVEAKPHLPGAALTLITCLAAHRWVRRGFYRDALVAGVAAGLATGMVPTAAVAALAVAVMPLLRREPILRRAAHGLVAGVAAVAAFAVTNPFVVIHLARGGGPLAATFDNSRAFYQSAVTADVLGLAARHALTAVSIPVAVAAAVAVAGWAVRRRRPGALAVLLFVPAAAVMGVFVLFAGGKNAEYARFALFPSAVVAILIGWGLAQVRPAPLRIGLALVGVVATAGLATRGYVEAYLNDALHGGTRTSVSHWLENETPRGTSVIEVMAEPAPYAVPAFNLWRWRVLLTRDGSAPRGDIVLRALDRLPAADPPAGYRPILFDGGHPPAPIAWADKPFELLLRE